MVVNQMGASMEDKVDKRNLQTTIEDIVTRLKQGRFPNEQAISQGIVLRILKDLGWNSWDTNVVWPEYQTGEGRADFALCHPASKPAIFVEVKQPGKAENGIRQALEYAFHTGVPFIILTDGKTWSFYLPAEQGSYEDRRVYKLDLFERPAEEAADTLYCYLARFRVESGEALESARKEYRNRNRRSRARASIPEAWHDLIESGEELLTELLSNAVESKIGIRPNESDILGFLSKLEYLETKEFQAVVLPVDNRVVAPTRRTLLTQNSNPSRQGMMHFRGKSYPYENAKEAMVFVLKELAVADDSFLERCSQHPNAQGRKRRYIARNVEELYPDRPDLRDCCEKIDENWLVGTNINNDKKKALLRMAAEVAGLTYGKDIVVDF